MQIWNQIRGSRWKKIYPQLHPAENRRGFVKGNIGGGNKTVLQSLTDFINPNIISSISPQTSFTSSPFLQLSSHRFRTASSLASTFLALRIVEPAVESWLQIINILIYYQWIWILNHHKNWKFRILNQLFL